MTSDGFVISWVTSSKGAEIGDPWLMVLHEDRGWEFPGGSAEDDEDWDVTALRELFEEAGLLGTAKAYDEDLVEGGVVVWIEVDEEPVPEPWISNDPKIAEVGWCIEVPGNLAWDASEVEKVRSHDWSDSETLGS